MTEHIQQPYEIWIIEHEKKQREFMLIVRSALLMIVRAIEKRYDVTEK